MLGDISVQKDDVESLKNSSPIYQLNYKVLKSHYLRYHHFATHFMGKFFSKDTDFFKEFWKVDEIPDKSQYFYHHFPKVGTNYDSDHHVSNIGIFMNHFYLGRWLPEFIQKLMFPLENTADALQNKKLTAKQMPTINECRLCQRFEGLLIFNRTGEWFCIYDNGGVDINETDELGKKFFTKYEDFRTWKKHYTDTYYKLEDQALTVDDEAEFNELERKMKEMRTLKRDCKVDHKNVLTIKG